MASQILMVYVTPVSRNGLVITGINAVRCGSRAPTEIREANENSNSQTSIRTMGVFSELWVPCRVVL